LGTDVLKAFAYSTKANKWFGSGDKNEICFRVHNLYFLFFYSYSTDSLVCRGLFSTVKGGRNEIGICNHEYIFYSTLNHKKESDTSDA